MHDTRWRLLAVQLYTGGTELISKDCDVNHGWWPALKLKVKRKQYLKAKRKQQKLKLSKCLNSPKKAGKFQPDLSTWENENVNDHVSTDIKCPGVQLSRGGGGWQSAGWRRCVQASVLAAVIFNIQVFMPISSRKPSSIYSRNTAHNTAQLLPPASCRHWHTWTTFWVWVLEVPTKFRGTLYCTLPTNTFLSVS